LLAQTDKEKAKKLVEQFSIECRETKTKVITQANHKGNTVSQSKLEADVKHGKTCTEESQLDLV